MATFAKSTFNTVRYAAARPTYPRQLFDFVFKFHEERRGAKWDLAVDLGCGTGQATTELTPFRRVIGVDPSQKMIDVAQSLLSDLKTQPDESRRPLNEIEFVQGQAESLGFLKDKSVDMITAAQACHWFNWDKMWPEAARILRSGGTAAFWGYSEFRLSHHPHLTPLIHSYSQGSDPKSSLGPHWEQPGRSIVDNHLQDVPDPSESDDGWEKMRRVYFVGDHHPSLPPPHNPTILKKRMTWDTLLDYLNSFSSLHTFKERNPEDAQNPEGDIAVRFWKRLQKETNGGDGKDGEQWIDVEWPLAIIMARRK